MEEGLLIGRIASELATISPDAVVPAEALIRTRETLDEVKALTEYEDEKATRVLTIVTIFGALAGLMFTRIADQYPLRGIIAYWGLWHFQTLLVTANYFLFGLFIFLTVSGALVIFHATRVRFKYPSLPTADGELARVKSYLFYKEIIQVAPGTWARSFLSSANTAQPSHVRADLDTDYFKNHVTEAYLIAAKVADKLRYLMPAQSILAWAMRVLLFWLFVYATTLVLVPDMPKPQTPTQIVLISRKASAEHPTQPGMGSKAPRSGVAKPAKVPSSSQ